MDPPGTAWSRTSSSRTATREGTDGAAPASRCATRRTRCATKRGRSVWRSRGPTRDRKSTRLNSSHGYISYAVFCLKKKKDARVNQGESRRAEELTGEAENQPLSNN